LKHSTLTRLLPWLLIAVCPPLLGRCGGALEHGTETGNPPVVEQQKLHVLLRDTGVEVVGDAGAISPGASVRVTNRTTGESAEASARADGSVNVVVPGSLQDEYEVTVSNGSGSQTVLVRAQTSGGSVDAGSGPPGDTADAAAGPPGACTSLRETLATRVSAKFANMDKTCQRDEDCVFMSTDSSCYASCESVLGSLSGSNARASAAVLLDIAPLCNEFDSLHCETPRLTCPSGYPTVVCNGTCAEVDALSCDELTARAAVRRTTVVNDASRTCSRDADCALAQADIRCVASCGNFQSVASSALEGLRRSIAGTEGHYCSTMEARACPGPIALPCEPPLAAPRATCNAGQCEVTYVALP
jgi:hypothetical protein